MDNVIPPLTPPNLNNPSPDKVITGELETVPEVLQKIRPTDGLLLKFLNASDSSSTDGVVKLNLHNREVEIPVKLNLDARLNLPEGRDNQAIIRLSGADNSILKIISINNENPGKYMATAPASNINQPSAALVLDTGNVLQKISLHPLDLTPVLDNIIKDVKLPPEVLAVIRDSFSGSKADFKLKDIISSEVGLRDLPNIDKAVNDTIGRLKLILSNLANQENFDAETIDDALENIKMELRALKGLLLSGEAVNPTGDKLAGIKTILGNVLAEHLPVLDNGARIPEGTKLLLEIREFLFSEKAMAENLTNLKLPSSFSSEKSAIMQLLDNLRLSGKADLSAKITDKIPGDNAKMLSNMVNFMKGALNGNSRQWLGAELINELDQSGVEGKEVAARLNNFMNTSLREGAGWRQVEIPFLTGDTISKIKVAVRNNEEEDKKSSSPKKTSGTRFVVDTTFSKLGDFQFDGFAIAKDKRFDLVIRTSRQVDDGLYAEIFRLFKTTLFEFEYSGNVKLNVKENFIKICEDGNNATKTGFYI